MEIRRLAGAGGAEVLGVDLGRDLDDATFDAIRAALNEHCVVFFREQVLDAGQQKAFARRFGEIFVHPLLAGKGGDPEIVEVRREPGDASYFGEAWHADTTMCAEPPMGTALYGVEVPPHGGDTLFANQYLAWESLSAGLQATLAGLKAVHRHGDLASVHPVVRTHPETGRRLLFVNEFHTFRFDGWTEAESRPLLDFLFRHGNRPEFTIRFRWKAGSLAFWDNRSTKHLAIGDTGPYRRVMRRVQVCGDRPI